MPPLTEDDGSERPLSVKEISDRAKNMEYTHNIPFKTWIRTAQRVQTEASMYLIEGNFSQAYLLYMRYSLLIVDCLSKHPEAKIHENRKIIRRKIQTINGVLDNMERLKPILNQQYEAWLESQAEKAKAQAEGQIQDSKEAPGSNTYKQYASKDPALSYAGRLLDASENQDLAVELAQKEIRRRDLTRRAANRDGMTGQAYQDRRTAGFWDNWTQEIAEKQAEDEEVFRQQMASTRQALDRNVDSSSLPAHQQKVPRHSPKASLSSVNFSYPRIAKPTPVEYSYESLEAKVADSTPPVPPPKEQEASLNGLLFAPERPEKLPYTSSPLSAALTPEVSEQLPTPPPKVVEQQSTPAVTKPHGVAFKPAAYLENGEPVRPVFLPRQLRARFLDMAAENTKRGLEMCGILCGTAVNNALFVRCLLIPEQKCTSDTCETENEASMLEYCIEEDLLVLGWIHTHPTQTCFMSSRDLHTQSGYQVMLPESIAIVCAPRFEPSYGIFRLTNPPGLQHILDCPESSTFHAHSVKNLYTEAEHPPGHVYEHEGLNFYVHDIRPGAIGKKKP